MTIKSSPHTKSNVQLHSSMLHRKHTQSFSPRGVVGIAGYLSVHPMAQCVVHALKGLACRASVTSPCSPASHCSALTSPSLHTRGCASPSRTHRGHKNKIFFSMGPKRRHPAVPGGSPRGVVGSIHSYIHAHKQVHTSTSAGTLPKQYVGSA